MDEWFNNPWHIHTIEHYSVIKRYELLICMMTWMNLQRIIEQQK